MFREPHKPPPKKEGYVVFNRRFKEVGGPGSGNRGHIGRPGEVGGSISLAAANLATYAGFSVHYYTGSVPATGYTVGGYGERIKTIDYQGGQAQHRIENFSMLDAHAQILAEPRPSRRLRATLGFGPSIVCGKTAKPSLRRRYVRAIMIAMSTAITNAIRASVVREMRNRHLSQGQIAALAGCTQPAISALITGKARRPSIGLLIGIADALGMSIDSLVRHQGHQKSGSTLEARVSRLERMITGSSNAPALPAVVNLEQYLTVLRLHKSDLQAKGVEHVAVFGSAVRSDLRPDSDIDLLVSFKAERTPDVYSFVGLGNYLSQLLGRKSDIVDEQSVLPQLRLRVEKESVRAF